MESLDNNKQRQSRNWKIHGFTYLLARNSTSPNLIPRVAVRGAAPFVFTWREEKSLSVWV